MLSSDGHRGTFFDSRCGAPKTDLTDPSDNVVAQKVALRRRATAQRERLSSRMRAVASEAVAQQCGALSILAGPTAVVSSYRAIGSELDPEALERGLAELGHVIALPITTKRGRPLDFRRWRQGEPLVARQWGIREPELSAASVEPDVLFVPLLAFDGMGRRLGYGGGYYDRTLGRLRGGKAVIAIGLAFDTQEVDAVPHCAYDERLDWVLTPSGLRSFSTMED